MAEAFKKAGDNDMTNVFIFRTFAATIVVSLLFTNPCHSQDLSFVGSLTLGGESFALAPRGDTLFCATEGGLMVFDISRPDSIDYIGGNPFLQYLSAIELVGDFAFATISRNDSVVFATFEISNPRWPSIIAVLDGPPWWDLRLYAGYAYVFGESSLGIIDIFSPGQPQIVETIPAQLRDLAFVDTFALALTSDRELEIWDMANPTEPAYIYNYLSPVSNGLVNDIAIKDHVVFLIGQDSSHYNTYFEIVDFEHPMSPIYLGNCIVESMSNDICIGPETAFITSPTWIETEYVTAIDLNDLSNPVTRDIYHYGESIFELEAYDSKLCVAGHMGLLTIVEAADLDSLYRLSEWGWFCHLENMIKHEGYIYATGIMCDMLTIDITEPAAPDLLGNTEMSGMAFGLGIQGDYLMVSAYDLHVFDLSNPGMPALVTTYPLSYPTRGLDIENHVLYVGSNLGMAMIDITDPPYPAFLGSFSCPQVDISVLDHVAYVIDRTNVEIIDVADPALPFRRSIFPVAQFTRGVQVSGSYAYVATENYGLVIINVDDPDNPILAARYDTPGFAAHVEISGSRAFVADGDSGLLVLDVTEPSAPTLLARYCTNSPTEVSRVEGDYIYLGTQYSLLILDGSSLGISDDPPNRPSDFSLSQNFPNPFNAVTNISYELPSNSEVMIEIFDITGRRVDTILPGNQKAGKHDLRWNADRLTSGIYFYRLSAGRKSECRAAILLK